MLEIATEHIPARQGRSNPRVLKKPGVEIFLKKTYTQGKWNQTGTTHVFYSQYCLALNREVLIGVLAGFRSRMLGITDD